MEGIGDLGSTYGSGTAGNVSSPPHSIRLWGPPGSNLMYSGGSVPEDEANKEWRWPLNSVYGGTFTPQYVFNVWCLDTCFKTLGRFKEWRKRLRPKLDPLILRVYAPKQMMSDIAHQISWYTVVDPIAYSSIHLLASRRLCICVQVTVHSCWKAFLCVGCLKVM
jgi:hypothetical protein